MRRVRLTAETELALETQVDYLLRQGAPQAAQSVKSNVDLFVKRTLPAFPHIGHHTAEHDLFECAVPGTRIILWYVVEDAEITIVALWHVAQDR